MSTRRLAYFTDSLISCFKTQKKAYTSCNRLRSSPLSCIATEHELISGKNRGPILSLPCYLARPPKRHWRVQKIDLAKLLQITL
ncbi:MAG: hypothetical protein JWQ49_2801 [Edaphobacter sp.]|nr:hypothetical protein [Edaphobacter sp.]